jgi:3-(3-hydroxy-phenyl)propionate hydroxylase
MPAERVQVIVAGAGPVGLTAAAYLVRHGVDVVVVEAEPAAHQEWRASTFHPPTLQLLEEVDATPLMLERGLIADRYQIRERRGDLVAEFDYQWLTGDTPYPFRLQLEQYKLAEILIDRLDQEASGSVRYGHRVQAVDQGALSVTVTAETPCGRKTFNADYLIGADGAHSVVRQSLGLPFEGFTYEDRFLLISTDLELDKYLPGLCHVNYLADPDEYAMLLRIPDVWRVMVPVPAGRSDDEARSDARMRATVAALVNDAIDWETVRVATHQLYKVHQRIAGRLRVGRVALIGDAAHLNSPIGGFGLNSGIHDAFDLGRRLVRILNGSGKPEAELDAFSTRRREAAEYWVQRLSHANTRMLSEKDPGERQKTWDRLIATTRDPVAGRDWLLNASMISGVSGIGAPPEYK